MWQKARMVTSSATVTPGPKKTFGSIVTSRPISVSWLNQTVLGAISVAPPAIAASRARRWKMPSTCGELARAS